MFNETMFMESNIVKIVHDSEENSSTDAIPRRSIVRRSDRIRPGLRGPIIAHEPPITRIGSFNAQSVGNKYADIYDRIMTGKLHLCAIVETWHDSVNSPQLIACAPPGYTFVEKARPRDGLEAATLRTNHGGICLFHVTSLTSREVPLPVYTSFEVLAVYIHGAQRNVLVITLYRPGSEVVSSGFFREFSDVLERTATFSCPMIILGDVNLHLDDASNPHTIQFSTILEQFCLVQHVHSITHHRGHTLDVVITRLEHPVRAVHVEPPVLFDHAFIVADMDLRIVHDWPNSVVRRRQWRKVDFEALREDLRRSD